LSAHLDHSRRHPYHDDLNFGANQSDQDFVKLWFRYHGALC